MRTHRMGSILLLLFILFIAVVPASAQWIPCLGDSPTGGAWKAPDLPTIPELVSNGGKLRATLVLSDEQQRITFKTADTLTDAPGGLRGARASGSALSAVGARRTAYCWRGSLMARGDFGDGGTLG